MKARLCTREDKSVWVELNKAYMEEELGGEDLLDEGLDLDIDVTKLEEAFEGAMEREDAIYLVLFQVNDKVLGFANLVRFFSVWANGDSILIDDFYLEPDYRGLGYGNQCLAAVEDFARENGAKRVQFNSELRDEADDEERFGQLGYSLQEMGFLVKYL